MKEKEISTISVIIPVPSYSKELPILSSLREVDYPEEKIEIILSIGNLPSVQRNKAANVAQCDLLYFFNGDAQVQPDIFKKVIELIKNNPTIAGIGGPDLTPPENNRLQHIFGYAMGSYFAHGRMRARYLQVGQKRAADEKELLLSNLAVRRDIYLKTSGFDERLYPNEENEFINRISQLGYKFVYSPDIKIYRDRRKTIREFTRQFYRYGQGRMNQIFIEGVKRNLYFCLPLILLVYLMLSPFLNMGFIRFTPFFVYLFLGFIDATIISIRNKRNLLFILPFVYLAMHLAYSIGMLSSIYYRIWPRKKFCCSHNCELIYVKSL